MEQKPNKSSAEVILGLEMQICNLEDDLDHLTLDYQVFSAKLREMEKALAFIRSNESKIISLQGFKELINDIKHTDKQVFSLRVGINTVNDKIDDKLKAIDYYNMLFEQEQEYLSRKILPFKKSEELK